MPNVQPIQQPVLEDLRNCLMIAELGVDSIHHIDHEQDAAGCLGDIARLLKHAIEGLSEPSLAAVQAAATMLREAPDPGHVDILRYARDTAAVILKAQLE